MILTCGSEIDPGVKEIAMVFAEVVQGVLTVIILVLLATQILVPLFRGTPFFPVFRRERRLVKDLTEAREEVQDAELEEHIDVTRRRAADIRRRPDAESGPASNRSGE